VKPLIFVGAAVNKIYTPLFSVACAGVWRSPAPVAKEIEVDKILIRGAQFCTSMMHLAGDSA
jgi:hypothetical protein